MPALPFRFRAILLSASLLILIVSLAGCGGSSASAPPVGSLPVTTTVQNETANNTSTANTFSARGNGDAGPGNVSKMPVQQLLYPGSTTRVFAHLQPWFGNSNHIDVGY